MNVGVVDIGTNSMRLLIKSADTEVGRWVEVTGLGRGVDETHRLGEQAMQRTLDVFAEFGSLMRENHVGPRLAIATSACRDASNRGEFFDRAEEVLGVRPVLISGEQEAEYAFRGAVGQDQDADDLVVSDIGGGSTEFVSTKGTASVDIGSVRLTERMLPDRPATPDQISSARSMVGRMFSGIILPARSVVGVAGTWTSLAAMAQDLERYQPSRVHGFELGLGRIGMMIDELAPMTLRQTEAIPSLDPKRAPVILAGAVVAESVLKHLGVDKATASEKDTLDGAATELLALL